MEPKESPSVIFREDNIQPNETGLGHPQNIPLAPESVATCVYEVE